MIIYMYMVTIVTGLLHYCDITLFLHFKKPKQSETGQGGILCCITLYDIYILNIQKHFK